VQHELFSIKHEPLQISLQISGDGRASITTTPLLTVRTESQPVQTDVVQTESQDSQPL